MLYITIKQQPVFLREIFARNQSMSTAWRAENGPKTLIAAVCSYVPVSWSKIGRVANFNLGPARSPGLTGGHRGQRARGPAPASERG